MLVHFCQIKHTIFVKCTLTSFCQVVVPIFYIKLANKKEHRFTNKREKGIGLNRFYITKNKKVKIGVRSKDNPPCESSTCTRKDYFIKLNG